MGELKEITLDPLIIGITVLGVLVAQVPDPVVSITARVIYSIAASFFVYVFDVLDDNYK